MHPEHVFCDFCGDHFVPVYNQDGSVRLPVHYLDDEGPVLSPALFRSHRPAPLYGACPNSLVRVNAPKQE